MAKLTESQRNALASNQFVFSKTRKYPVHDKGHAMYALKIGNIQYAKGNLTKAQYNQIVSKVNTMWGFNARFKK